MIAGYYKSRI